MIRPRFTPLLAALLLGCCGPLLAAPKHALTLYDEPPKYPADFKHFDYVNPDAPKGGILRQADFGGFDSLNPFIGKGVSAPSLGLIYDTLAFQSQDEPFTEYGLLAEKIERHRTTATCASTCAPRPVSAMARRSPPKTWCSPSRRW